LAGYYFPETPTPGIYPNTGLAHPSNYSLHKAKDVTIFTALIFLFVFQTMQALQPGYFGTHDPLPSSRQLRAGKLTCMYENGNLRYIRAGHHEIIRLIYTAVRDQNWLTAVPSIENEQIEETTSSFVITYTNLHQLGDIRYRMKVRIEGLPDNSISYEFAGESLSNFMRNRIGICVLHPIQHFSGRNVRVTRPNSSWYKITCPVLVNPHQPLLNIESMEWSPLDEMNARLTFAGDVFETEDQRNWTDASFKTYSTPLILPSPVPVSAGERLTQSVRLEVNPVLDLDSRQVPIRIQLSDEKYPFPRIGYARSAQTLTQADIDLLQQVPFDHYRVEIRFSHDWQLLLQLAVSEARQLNAKLELVCFFGPDFIRETEALMSFLQGIENWNAPEEIASLLILTSEKSVSAPDTIEQVTHKLKSFLSKTQLGAGTDDNFAELNRTREFSDDVGFLSYSISPQVHLSDTRILIENLEAQQHTVQTALGFAGGKAIHISPVTLRIRQYPEANLYTGSLPSNVDTRQYSTFAAAWTLLSLHYLAQARQLTYYETVGMRGIIQGSEEPAAPSVFQTRAGDVFPVYTYLKQLKSLQPASVLRSSSSHPLEVDALVVESGQGIRTAFLINFSEEPQTVELAGNSFPLSATSIRSVEL
jgi:hypothetical protein